MPVVTDPSSIADAPDIMFGAGINDIVALLARFPDVPAVQVSQVWDHWNTYPCLLPQVMLYVAVDDLNAELFVNEFGVPRDRIRIVHNAVDLHQVAARKKPLPARPARALVFVKQDNPYVEVVRAACVARNITADFFGYQIGNPIDDPLGVIADYDLVIGAARTALEGAVGGAAVLVADHRGLAGLLTTANLRQYKKENFGRELLTRPIEAATLGTEIDAYDPADAAAVSAALRDESSLDRQLEKLEEVFNEAIDRFRRAPPTPEDSRKALSSFLSRHLPRPWEPSPRHERFRGGHYMEEQYLAKAEEILTRISAVEARARANEERMAAAALQIAAIATRASANGERAAAATPMPAVDAPIAAGEQLRRDYSTDRA